MGAYTYTFGLYMLLPLRTGRQDPKMSTLMDTYFMDSMGMFRSLLYDNVRFLTLAFVGRYDGKWNGLVKKSCSSCL
jgi:hypothetical protein